MLNLGYYFVLTIFISLVSGLYEQCFYKKEEGVCLRQDECKLIGGQKGTVIPYSSPNICIDKTEKTINKVVCCIKTISVISNGKTKISGRCLNTESCMNKFKKLSFEPYYECTLSSKNAVLCPIKSFTTKLIFPPPLTKTITPSLPTPTPYYDIFTVQHGNTIDSIYQLKYTLRTEHPDVRGVIIRAGGTSIQGTFLITPDQSLESHYEMFKNNGFKIGYFFESHSTIETQVYYEVIEFFRCFEKNGININENVPELPVFVYFKVGNFYRTRDLDMKTRTELAISFVNRVKEKAPQLKVGICAHILNVDNEFFDYNMIKRNNIIFWLVGEPSSLTTTYDMLEYESDQNVNGMTGKTGFTHVYKNW